MDDFYIIAGLGNPGRKYNGSRHNVGFEVINILADRFDIATDYIRHKAVCGRGVIEGNKVLLAMPQTFMDLSGESVRQLVDYYKIKGFVEDGRYFDEKCRNHQQLFYTSQKLN